MEKRNNTHIVNDVEIFKVGTWNGDPYTEKDLDEIVNSYNEIGDKLKPYLKFGHDKNQKLAQNSGLPALGWINALRRKGKSLMADFKDVPDKVKELMDKKAYKRVSSEIFLNLVEGGKKFPKALKAVALLGADTPAITSLDDILALYTTESENYDSVKVYTMEVSKVSEEKTFEKEYNEAQLQIKQYEIDLKEKDDKISKLESELQESKDSIKEKEFTIEVEKVNYYLDTKIEEGKLKPVDREKYFSLSVDEEEKKITGFEMVQGILDEAEKVKEFKEDSKATEIPEGVDLNDEGKQSELHYDRAMEYMKEHGMEDTLENYKEALRQTEGGK